MKFNLLDNYYFFYENLIILSLSLVPCVFLFAYILYTDRKSKEPVSNILIASCSGFLVIGLSLFIGDYFRSIYNVILINIDFKNIIFIFGNAFVEEISKCLFFIAFLYNNKKYDDIYDGIVYLGIIALSFAGIENVIYAFNESTFIESASLAIVRDMTTIPVHLICGLVMGHYLSFTKFSKVFSKKIRNLSLALFFPLLIHGSYNFLLVLLSNNTNRPLIYAVLPVLLFMIVIYAIAIKLISKNKVIDKIYRKNSKYPKRYNYLMTHNEFKKKLKKQGET